MPAVRRVARSAPGVSELMVHPGVFNVEPAGLETGYDWEGDLGAVTPSARPNSRTLHGIKLIT